jgi:hypothetical protein
MCIENYPECRTSALLTPEFKRYADLRPSTIKRPNRFMFSFLFGLPTEERCSMEDAVRRSSLCSDGGH